MFSLFARVSDSILNVPKLLLRVQTLDAKSVKKCYHEDTLEAFHLWTLSTSVKAERPTSRSPPIKVLDFRHRLTNGHRVKPPKIQTIQYRIVSARHHAMKLYTIPGSHMQRERVWCKNFYLVAREEWVQNYKAEPHIRISQLPHK